MHAIGNRVRGRDRDIGESDGLESVDVLAERKRSSDAADVGTALRTLLGAEVVLRDDVAHPDAPARRAAAVDPAATLRSD